MHFLSFTFLASLFIALHGMVIPSTNQVAMSPASGQPPTDRVSCAGCGTSRGIPTIQNVNTGMFRNQYRAVQSANSRNGYYRTRWDPLTAQWNVDFTAGALPTDESFAADHIFEIQMLTMWMNAEDRDLSYFDGSLQDLKDVINGRDNAVYIPTDLNCWKATAVKMATESVLETGTCNNLQLGELTAYMRAELPNMQVVVSIIHDFIEQVADADDAQDFYNVAAISIECLMGGLTF